MVILLILLRMMENLLVGSLVEIEDYILSRIETYLDHQEDIFLQWMSIMRMTCTTLRHNFFHLITFMEQMAVVYMEKLVKYTRKQA